MNKKIKKNNPWKVTFVLGLSILFILIILTSVKAKQDKKIIEGKEYIIENSKAFFFYSPDCLHCEEVFPLVFNYSLIYPITFLDASKNNFNIPGVPFVVVRLSDDTLVPLFGTVEITSWLGCALEEKTTEDCRAFNELN